MANNKIEIDAGMVTPRQPLGREDMQLAPLLDTQVLFKWLSSRN